MLAYIDILASLGKFFKMIQRCKTWKLRNISKNIKEDIKISNKSWK
ncbi:hypothetical protein CSCA_2198 [Clostridium scatologenes]|uniref:Uncharacterized protein n=1 Tax=Clostridium scatologenes TaxID=1548 RepID=A0A0E3JNI7_CLOSL|nr:hypothetical protein CSCA_2198 [Clostridium scatologenes]